MGDMQCIFIFKPYGNTAKSYYVGKLGLNKGNLNHVLIMCLENGDSKRVEP
jgi:hypothetical protein